MSSSVKTLLFLAPIVIGTSMFLFKRNARAVRRELKEIRKMRRGWERTERYRRQKLSGHAHHVKEKMKKIEEVQAMPKEERDAFYSSCMDAKRERIEKKRLDNEALERALGEKGRIVIDCSFADDKPASLCRQIRNIHGFNKKAEKKVGLHVVGLEDAFRDKLHQGGAENWRGCRLHKEGVEVVFAKEIEEGRVTFLSPDSPHVLEDVEMDRIYVIGGIIDKSIASNRSLYAATARSIPHARLPLQETFPDIVGKTVVLNVDACAQILFNKRQGAAWEDAILPVLTPRMRAKFPSKETSAERASEVRRRRRNERKGQHGEGGGGGEGVGGKGGEGMGEGE